MLNIRLLLTKLFTKLDIMVEPIYYVGGNDVLPAPLSKEEEEELVNKLGENDEAIRSILIERNLRLVVYIARKFENTGVGVEDLISVGTIGLIIAILLSPKINILNLGDDVAIGLGENPEKIRFLTLMVMIPMCAAAVAVGKNIAFVGLIVPQIVRKLLGEDYRRNIPCAFLLGAVLLTYADIAARMLFAPYETPIGVFTALIGIPFFISVARKERG